MLCANVTYKKIYIYSVIPDLFESPSSTAISEEGILSTRGKITWHKVFVDACSVNFNQPVPGSESKKCPREKVRRSEKPKECKHFARLDIFQYSSDAVSLTTRGNLARSLRLDDIINIRSIKN